MINATSLVLLAIRFALFGGCRLTLLPWLFSEAKHASLDSNLPADAQQLDSMASSSSPDALPSPATSTSTQRQTTSVARAWQIVFNQSPASLLLSLSFEEGVTPFFLVILEAIGFQQSTLRAQWTGSLYGIVALAVALIPMGMSVFLTYTLLPQAGPSALPHRLSLSLVPFSLWLLFFVKVPLPSALSQETSYLGSSLAKTAVIGVTLIAILSGSGASGAALDSLSLWSSSRAQFRRDPSPSDVRSAEASFQKACEDLDRTKREIDRVHASANPSASQGGFFAGLDRAVRGSAKDRELKSLNLELTSLSMLASSMRDELDELKARRRMAEWNFTLSGKVWLAIGHVFAAYCVMRMVVSLLSLLFLNYSSSASSSSPDIMSTLLARLLRIFGINIDVPTWSKQISLLLVGVLILARLRVVLNYLARFFRAASSGASTSFLLLFLSEVLVIYLLATLIQLRASLPLSFSNGSILNGKDTFPHRGPMSEQGQPLLASLPDFNIVFGALFDTAFLLSAAGTVAVRYFTSRQEGILFNGGRS